MKVRKGVADPGFSFHQETVLSSLLSCFSLSLSLETLALVVQSWICWHSRLSAKIPSVGEIHLEVWHCERPLMSKKLLPNSGWLASTYLWPSNSKLYIAAVFGHQGKCNDKAPCFRRSKLEIPLGFLRHTIPQHPVMLSTEPRPSANLQTHGYQ